MQNNDLNKRLIQSIKQFTVPTTSAKETSMLAKIFHIEKTNKINIDV